MNKRLSLAFGALLLAVLLAFGSVNFAHASALKMSVRAQALKSASEVIEILHGEQEVEFTLPTMFIPRM